MASWSGAWGRAHWTTRAYGRNWPQIALLRQLPPSVRCHRGGYVRRGRAGATGLRAELQSGLGVGVLLAVPCSRGWTRDGLSERRPSGRPRTWCGRCSPARHRRIPLRRWGQGAGSGYLLRPVGVLCRRKRVFWGPRRPAPFTKGADSASLPAARLGHQLGGDVVPDDGIRSAASSEPRGLFLSSIGHSLTRPGRSAPPAWPSSRTTCGTQECRSACARVWTRPNALAAGPEHPGVLPSLRQFLDEAGRTKIGHRRAGRAEGA